MSQNKLFGTEKQSAKEKKVKKSLIKLKSRTATKPTFADLLYKAKKNGFGNCNTIPKGVCLKKTKSQKR